MYILSLTISYLIFNFSLDVSFANLQTQCTMTLEELETKKDEISSLGKLLRNSQGTNDALKVLHLLFLLELYRPVIHIRIH